MKSVLFDCVLLGLDPTAAPLKVSGQCPSRMPSGTRPERQWCLLTLWLRHGRGKGILQLGNICKHRAIFYYHLCIIGGKKALFVAIL